MSDVSGIAASPLNNRTGHTVRAGILLGSLRKHSYNRMVARTLPELAPEGLECVLLPELHEIPLYDQDIFDAGVPRSVLDLADAVCGCEALVIVTPEYNYSIPGVLKNGLDWLSRLKDKPLVGKPVAIQSASMGALGGVRAQYHLRQVLVALDVRPLNVPEVIIGQVQLKVDADAARLRDADSRRFCAEQLQALLKATRAQPVSR